MAIESADVVLMKSNLFDILVAFDIARATYRRIILNFVWAFGYNIIGEASSSPIPPTIPHLITYLVVAVPIAAGVFYPWWRTPLPPWVAGLAMALSSLSVLASSLLLQLHKPKDFGRHHHNDHNDDNL